jgi:hypothetical protein
MRISEKYKKYWELKCFNFKLRPFKNNICRYCEVIIPERSHHCRQCKCCIRKFDHHCFFVNNCIGVNTYKLFINMLFYGCLTCSIVTIIMLKSLKFVLNEYWVKYIY